MQAIQMVNANVEILKHVVARKTSKTMKPPRILCTTTKNEIVKNLLTDRSLRTSPKGAKAKVANRRMTINS